MEKPLFVFVDTKNDCFVNSDGFLLIGDSIYDLTTQLYDEISKDFVISGLNVFLDKTLVYKIQEISWTFYNQLRTNTGWKKPSEFTFFF